MQGEQGLRHSIGRVAAEGLNLSLRSQVPPTVHLNSRFLSPKGTCRFMNQATCKIEQAKREQLNMKVLSHPLYPILDETKTRTNQTRDIFDKGIYGEGVNQSESLGRQRGREKCTRFELNNQENGEQVHQRSY